MHIPPTNVGTFRDKRGNFWVNVEAVCELLGANPALEKRKIKGCPRFHPHTFQRDYRKSDGSRGRNMLFALPAEELSEWCYNLSIAPTWKCERSGRKIRISSRRLAQIRSGIKQQKAALRLLEMEVALSA